MQDRVSIEVASGQEVSSEQLMPKKRRYTISEACDEFREKHLDSTIEAFKKDNPEMGAFLDEVGAEARREVENIAVDCVREALDIMRKRKIARFVRQHVSMSADSERGREIHSAARGFVEGLMDNPELYTYAKGMSTEERDALFASIGDDLKASNKSFSTEIMLQAVAAHKQNKDRREQPEGAAAADASTTASGLGK